MKTLIYTGAVLMIGAGIYGFVDYKNKEGNKRFENLYKNESTDVADVKPIPVVEKEPVIEVKVEPKKEEVVRNMPEVIPAKKTFKKKKRVFNTKLFSRAALDERVFKKPPVVIEIDSTSSGKN